MESQGSRTLDEEVAALSRSADRDSLFMQANLYVTNGGQPALVRVRNLSPGGMLAEGPVRVAEGAAIEVELRNIGPVPGRVVWVGEGKFGIAFDRQVNPQVVRRQVKAESDLPPHLRRTGLERAPFRPRG
ncbi:PilZ domain-containing protein [Sphingopyxis indica]|uniref:PilZ domain-containing protein n=1 Tax=Sphingopyxis indica TaxID=436663 RepID=A0A239HGW6_9SPHN|nr:PilZ domain-containing protein [Sphingopyxis indica]SNS80288.1 PilZ domain-containing protein [Sphingopyxis indica]